MRRGYRLPSIRGLIASLFGFFLLIALLPLGAKLLLPIVVPVVFGLVIGFILGKLWRHFLHG